MNCLFCKQPSNSSISVEHILPESLGNKDHLLPRGIVCDNCNNYFASKIEKVVLDKPYFKNVRSRNFILTKKGRIVPEKILFPYKNGGWVNTWMDNKGFIFDTDNNTIIESIKDGRFNKLIIPIIDEPEQNDLDMSRFLAKVGLEFLVYKGVHDKGWVEEIVNKAELDPVRNYARYGNMKLWAYHQRRIYKEDTEFIDPINHPEPYEILHEFDFLYDEKKFLYFVVVIMGIEYVINLGEPEVDMYKDWLKNNNDRSPIRRYSEYKLPQ